MSGSCTTSPTTSTRMLCPTPWPELSSPPTVELPHLASQVPLKNSLISWATVLVESHASTRLVTGLPMLSSDLHQWSILHFRSLELVWVLCRKVYLQQLQSQEDPSRLYPDHLRVSSCDHLLYSQHSRLALRQTSST